MHRKKSRNAAAIFKDPWDISEEFCRESTLVEQLQQVLDMAKCGQIDNVLLACFNQDAETLTGYVNLTPNQRMTLTSCLQTELIGDIAAGRDYYAV